MASTTRTVKSRYERYASDRQPFLDRARQCSELTIPTLIPPEGHSKGYTYYTPWQSLGARGVNNLASKLLLSLLPPNSPFFRLVIDDFTKDKIAGEQGMGSKVDEGLNRIERSVQSEVEGTGVRPPVFLSFKHIIVGGSYFLYFPADGSARGYSLDSHVIARDPSGNVVEAITREEVNPETLDEDVYNLVVEQMSRPRINNEVDKDAPPVETQIEDKVEVYTRFYRDNKRWKSYQEILSVKIPGTEGSWPIKKPPFIALRWSAIQGEDYGRSYVEEYLGDLISLEGLSKAIVESAAASAKVVFLVSPNGVTSATDITEAESGDAIVGHKDDVHCLQTDKQADLKIAYEAVQTISERLSFAFLLNSAVQRKGERVTAEEIRYMAGELEDALGGVYSVMANEFQLPFVMRLMDRMTKEKRLPELPKGIVKPAIVTGLEALGRGHDLAKLQTFGSQVLQPLGPAGVQYLNVPEMLSRGATALGIDPKGLIKTPEDIAQEKQQAMQAQQGQQMADIAGKGVGPAIKAMSDNSQQQAQPPQATQGQ